MFREMELSSYSIKKLFTFSYISGSGNRKKYLYILENRNPKKLIIFQKMKPLCPSSKK